MKRVKKAYTQPMVKVVSFMVEGGFTVSGDPDSVNLPLSDDGQMQSLNDANQSGEYFNNSWL